MMRYEMRLLENGWAIWHVETNAPSIAGGRWQVNLGMEDAEDLTDILNDKDSSCESDRDE